MDIELRQVGQVVVVGLAGQIQIGDGAIMLQRTLIELLEAGRKHIVLDLGKVTYVDSSGLAELAASSKRVRTRGGEVRLLSPSPSVRDLLRITMFDEVFEIYREEEAALEACGSSKTLSGGFRCTRTDPR